MTIATTPPTDHGRARGLSAVRPPLPERQGTPDEEHGRTIAVALASKIVSKL